MTNAVSKETNDAGSGERREGTYITWEAFRDTLIQWMQEQGPDLV